MTHFPPLWAKSTEAAGLWLRLRSAPRSVLMLDYDGTLAPFHIDRFAATPYAGVEDRLVALSGLSRVRLVLVSGRAAGELHDLLSPRIRAEIWGSHGRERLSAEGSYELFALAPGQQKALEQAGLEMSAQGFAGALEVKPSSLAVHWRSFEPAIQSRLRALAESVLGGIARPVNLQLLPFDGGLELRSIDRTKGTAVAQIVAEEPAGLPVAYLGDDLTDEDAFTAVGPGGYSVLVRSEVRESAANFWLRPPLELIEFLDQWIAASPNPGATP